MGRVWFTSDLHLGHALVAEHRGFDSVAEHDAYVLDGWARSVSSGDQVWLLGDVAIPRDRDQFLGILAQVKTLPGEKHIILGNHDACHPMHRHGYKTFPMFTDVFSSVSTAARRRMAGRDVLLSHFPYTTDRGFETRYPQWRLPDLGTWLMHGHTHAPEKLTSGHEVHVGLDAWDVRPVPIDAVITIIEETDSGA